MIPEGDGWLIRAEQTLASVIYNTAGDQIAKDCGAGLSINAIRPRESHRRQDRLLDEMRFNLQTEALQSLSRCQHGGRVDQPITFCGRHEGRCRP